MKNLEEIIRDHFEKFGHLTLARIPNSGKAQAAFRPAGENGYRVEIHEDPIQALKLCLPSIEDDYDGLL